MKLGQRAAIIAGAYVALASAWIVLSGLAARAMASSVEDLERLERFKGIAFVAITGLGLFLLSYLVLRKQLSDEQAAERARETLLRSERTALAGLFVSSIAHDANNVLMVVGCTLDLLGEDPGVDPENRESLTDAQEAMISLRQMFADLKGMGRGSSVRVDRELRAMVQRIVGLLKGHSAMKNCQVVIDAPEAVTLSVFPVLIDQVLINLLLNAADATDGRGHLEVKLRVEKERVRLEVHDDGKGLPAGLEASLFKPFATTKPHGTGLGLVSVRECALAHGGSVEYARSPRGGAAFSVCLPRSTRG